MYHTKLSHVPLLRRTTKCRHIRPLGLSTSTLAQRNGGVHLPHQDRNHASSRTCDDNLICRAAEDKASRCFPSFRRIDEDAEDKAKCHERAQAHGSLAAFADYWVICLKIVEVECCWVIDMRNTCNVEVSDITNYVRLR